MDELKEIYERITFLRQKGVKMKEMAEQVDFAPSVFSAIYSTVLPAYLKGLAEGKNAEQALDNALVWVNNVSKKKLLGSLAALKAGLQAIDFTDKPVQRADRNPLLDMLERNMKESLNRVSNYSGIYLSYSLSSSACAMKVEPYLLAPAEDGDYVQVGHASVYGTVHWGGAMMNGHHHLYLTFNEQDYPQLSLFHISLKLPMFERPPFLRGLYLCFDYNFNPIARRILFVKYSDSTSVNDFLQLRGELKTPDQLTEEEKLYYGYTCQPGDAIRLCNVPSPRMSEADLVLEKKLLELSHEDR